ncbi:MAG: radical SAM protein [Cyclobacteriaceae bacterium]|nr:radical SAM protein [Cyclobacteriaceae bacterium]
MRLIHHPILCNYYLTYRCNARCGFCDIWEKPSSYALLEHAQKNFSDLKRLGVKIIDFTGGEPLLHRQIEDFLQLAKDFGFITTLTTNGLLYPKKAQKLKGLIDMLHFSLDSSDKEQHDTMRGAACFDSVMKSIEVAIALGERPDILFTVFNDNTDQISQVYEKIVLPHKLVLILNPAFEYNGIGETPSQELFTELRKYGRKKNVYLNEAFITLRQNGGNDLKHPVCKAASSSVVISPDNKLVMPCYHLGMESFPIEDALYDLYRADKIKQLRSMEGRYPECQGCAINCYMQPSFAVNVNRYFFKALKSTLKYNWMKGTWRKLKLY